MDICKLLHGHPSFWSQEEMILLLRSALAMMLVRGMKIVTALKMKNSGTCIINTHVSTTEQCETLNTEPHLLQVLSFNLYNSTDTAEAPGGFPT